MGGEKIKTTNESKTDNKSRSKTRGNGVAFKKGYRKKRIPRPNDRPSVEGYDSNWEYLLHTTILKDWTIHTETLDYIVEHKYHPDFIRDIEGKKILLEAKGRFWDHAEYSKYNWIKKYLPENTELVFLFAEPTAPMPQAKRRKDGTKRTHSEWAEANGFRWFSSHSIPKEWIDETSQLEEDPERILEVE
jgi:hypothetical protein|tara:strand:+ start:1691 stop:2257 length:567 start_codon:yes stop_codon:yes gene_type:complete